MRLAQILCSLLLVLALGGCGGSSNPSGAGAVNGGDDGSSGGGGVAAGTYLETGGIVVMESENTPSSLGLWAGRTDISGFTGSGHLEFTGNTEMSGKATSPLTYTFAIAKAGSYRLIIRGGKTPPDGTPSDQANDCYVRMDGSYTAGGDAPLSTLQADTKMYGAQENSWNGWTETLDSHSSGKDPAIYNLLAGETYTLTVSGRSRSYTMDRIVLFETGTYALSAAKAPTIPESPQSSASKPVSN
jgi:hypothetical protein